MNNYVKITFVLFLLYSPFFFLLLIPKNTILSIPSIKLHGHLCSQITNNERLMRVFYCPIPIATLAVIKPDGMKYQNEILAILQENGFQVRQDRTLHLSADQIAKWYSEKQNEPYYPSLVRYLSRGPVRALQLSRVNAITELRGLIGPTNPQVARQLFPKSIRALYGTDIQENSIHASDSIELYEQEISILFDDTEKPTVNTRHL